MICGCAGSAVEAGLRAHTWCALARRAIEPCAHARLRALLARWARCASSGRGEVCGQTGGAGGTQGRAAAEVACIVLFPAMARLLANRCILADCEALQGHQVVEQAVQHCFHQLSRDRAQWVSDSLNQNLDGWNAEQ